MKKQCFLAFLVCMMLPVQGCSREVPVCTATEAEQLLETRYAADFTLQETRAGAEIPRSKGALSQEYIFTDSDGVLCTFQASAIYGSLFYAGEQWNTDNYTLARVEQNREMAQKILAVQSLEAEYDAGVYTLHVSRNASTSELELISSTVFMLLDTQPPLTGMDETDDFYGIRIYNGEGVKPSQLLMEYPFRVRTDEDVKPVAELLQELKQRHQEANFSDSDEDQRTTQKTQNPLLAQKEYSYNTQWFDTIFPTLTFNGVSFELPCGKDSPLFERIQIDTIGAGEKVWLPQQGLGSGKLYHARVEYVYNEDDLWLGDGAWFVPQGNDETDGYLLSIGIWLHADAAASFEFELGELKNGSTEAEVDAYLGTDYVENSPFRYYLFDDVLLRLQFDPDRDLGGNVITGYQMLLPMDYEYERST